MENYIDINHTKRIGNEIINYSSNLNDNAKQLINIIDRISNLWDGADSLKYINTMKDNCIVKLQNLSDLVEKYGQYLQQVPEAYNILDETFASKNINV